MAKYSQSKRIEKQGLGILETLLNANPLVTQLTKGDDDFPLIDGYVHLLSDKEEVDGNMLKVQVKSLKTNKDGTLSAQCGNDLLSHACSSSLPVLLLGVDVESQTAYWMYLSPESIKPLYEAQVAAGTKTTTLRLQKHNVIKSGVDGYVTEWKRICLHHRNSSNDRLMARYKKHVKRNLMAVSEDVLLERIKTLQELAYYRTNKGEYPMIEIVLSMSRSIESASPSVKIAYIELLERILHDKTTEALDVLVKLAVDENEQVKNKATEAIKNGTKYNHHVLNALGYGPYRAMLDFVVAKDISSKVVHTILRNLLDADYEGTSQTELHTITFHHGPLSVTPYLKTLRRDALKFLVKKYDTETTAHEKAEVLESISYATYKSDSPFVNNPELLVSSTEMVDDDTDFAVATYEEIIFPDGKMTPYHPVVYEVESQLSLLVTREKKPKGAEELLRRIREDKGDYRLFSMLAGDEMRLRHDIEWRDGRQQKESELKEILASINEGNANEWYDRIDAIANYKDSIEDWLFQTLREFLGDLAESKPEVAAIFAKRALESKSGLYFFFRSILWGLRKSSTEKWDEYVNYISEHSLVDQVEGILMSYLSTGTDTGTAKIREQDLQLLLEIAREKERFAFLDTGNLNRAIEYHSIKILLFLSSMNVDVRKELIEKIESNPELDTVYFHELGFALHCKWVKLEQWDQEDLEALVNALVNVQRFDHYEMEIIQALGAIDFELMMSVFERRIKHPYSSGYDAIPYHFDSEVAMLIRGEVCSKKIVSGWLAQISREDSGMASYHMSEFFERVGGEVLHETLSELILTGTKENILKAMDMFPHSDPVDPALCLEIVAVTDDKEILGMVSSRMRQTGGGTGSVGENIFAREMRKNKAQIEAMKARVTHQKSIKFCDRVLTELEMDIARSEQEHEREMREEREEYEAEKSE